MACFDHHPSSIIHRSTAQPSFPTLLSSSSTISYASSTFSVFFSISYFDVSDQPALICLPFIRCRNCPAIPKLDGKVPLAMSIARGRSGIDVPLGKCRCFSVPSVSRGCSSNLKFFIFKGGASFLLSSGRGNTGKDGVQMVGCRRHRGATNSSNSFSQRSGFGSLNSDQQ